MKRSVWPSMDGKAPLLLASMFFAVGAAGLLLTSADRADWGPFQAHQPPPRPVVYDAGRAFTDPPSLAELKTAPESAVIAEEPPLLVAAPQPTEAPAPPEPTPTPVPPMRVFGISSDSGASAAAATPTPPRIMIGAIAADDGDASETPEVAPETTEIAAE